MPGIFDGFSARLVEQAGFSGGFIFGGGLSETLLAYRVVGLMGFELNLAAVTRLAACCTIPLLADATQPSSSRPAPMRLPPTGCPKSCAASRSMLR